MIIIIMIIMRVYNNNNSNKNNNNSNNNSNYNYNNNKNDNNDNDDNNDNNNNYNDNDNDNENNNNNKPAELKFTTNPHYVLACVTQYLYESVMPWLRVPEKGWINLVPGLYFCPASKVGNSKWQWFRTLPQWIKC